MKKSLGFSLLEVLIAVTIIAVLGLIITGILSQTFRGSAKVELLGKVRENGQTALNRIHDVVSNSEKVICAASITTLDGSQPADPNSSLVVSRGGQVIRFVMHHQLSNANGYIEEEVLSVLNPNTPQSTYCETYASSGNFSSFATTRITDSVNLSLNSGTFTLNPEAGFKDVVTVSFFLSPAVNSPLGFESQLASPQQFQASIRIK